MNDQQLTQKIKEAIALHQQGELAKAKECYHAILLHFPQHFTSLHMLGVIAAQQQDFQKAIQLIREALQVNAASAIAHYNLGCAQEALNQDAEAAQSFEKASATQPNYIDAHLKCASLFQKCHQYEKALLHFNQVLELKPQDLNVQHDRGTVLLALGRAEEALSDFDYVLRIDPHHVLALNNRANVLVSLNKISEALISYDQALALYPRHESIIINKANALRNSFQFEEAAKTYELALSITPTNVEALINYTYVLEGLERYDEALVSSEKALELQPLNFEALNNCGLALNKLNRKEEALVKYSQAIACGNNNADVFFNRAKTLDELERYTDALKDYQQAISLRPDYVNALVNAGDVLSKLNSLDEALVYYEKALLVDPAHLSALGGKAATFIAFKKFDEAKTIYEQVLSINSNIAMAHNNIGFIHNERLEYQEALDAFTKGLIIQPDNVSILINRSNSFIGLKDYNKALEDVQKVLSIEPQNGDALANYGLILSTQRKLNEAIDIYKQALIYKPGHKEAINNLANAYIDIKQYDKALATFNEVLTMDPHFALGHWNQSLCLLLMGNYRRGFEEYEWRWECKFLEARREFNRPLWTVDQSLENKTIFVHAEQGLGDAIQFLRYVPLLIEKGAAVILGVTPPIKSLVKDWKGVSTVVNKGESLPLFDVHCPLMSLAFAFKTELDTIPNNVPYIHSDNNLVEQWKERLPEIEQPRIGIVWRGNPKNENDAVRSIGLSNLIALTHQYHNITWVSLKQEVEDDEKAILDAHHILRFEEELTDFSQTAALIDNLDLVISIDTSVAHLTGAMGRPLWVPLAYNADWRWLDDREDSPWYPTARLFRQAEPGNWQTVINALSVALKKQFSLS